VDRQLKQRLVGASVVVVLAVIFVPEFVKQQPPQDGVLSADAMTEIPFRPDLTTPALPESSQPATIVLPGGQTLQQPEMIGSDEGAMIAAPDDVAPPEDIVMPPGSGAEIDADETLASGDTMLVQTPQAEPAESVGEAAERPVEAANPTPPPVAEPARVATPEPKLQRLPPAPPVAAARQPEPAPRPSTPKPEASKPPPARTAGNTSDNTASPATPKAELPPIQLIARSEYGGDNTGSQQVSRQPRWMVQAGSFYVAQNASMLRDKLRQQSFPTSLQTAVIDGRTVYRVQVGPHATRAEGERTQARLLQEAGINGNLVPVYN